MEELGRVPLKALLELARRGTMTAVAQELGYTPGAISQQVAKLESMVGVSLIIKAGRGVRLTDAGQVLAQHAEAVLIAEETALAAVRATRTTALGPLSIGVFGSTAGAVLAPLVIALGDQYPGVQVHSQEVSVDDSAAAVRRGQVDVAFGLDYSTAPIPRDPEVELILLRSERFSLAATPQLLSRREITLAQAAQVPWILTPGHTQFGQAIRNACRTAGFEPSVVHEVTDTAACLALAAAGLGVTPVTPLMQQLARSTGHTITLQEDIRRHLVLMRHRATITRPTIAAVTAVAHQVVDAVDR